MKDRREHIISDFSIAEPADALSGSPLKDHWLVMHIFTPESRPPVTLTLALPALCWLALSAALAHAEGRRVGFIDGFQGGYDNATLIAHLRTKGVLFERMPRETWIPLDEFLADKAALVVSGNPWTRKPERWPDGLPADQAAALRAWIEDGGHLFFINSGANLLLEKKSRRLPEWLGFTGIAFRRATTTAGPGPDSEPVHPLTPGILLPEADHPFLGHLADAPRRVWMRSGYVTLGRSAGDAIVAMDDAGKALIYSRSVGKGEVAHFGRQAFRYRKGAKTPAEERANEQAVADMQGVLRNVADSWPGLLTTAAVLREREAQLPCRQRLLAWYRDPGRAIVPDHFADPAPRVGEDLKALRFDMGTGEFESAFFYLTNFGEERRLTMSVSDLVAPGGRRIARDHVLVRVQAPIRMPSPQPAARMRGKEKPLWLHRQTQLPPEGIEAFTCGPC